MYLKILKAIGKINIIKLKSFIIRQTKCSASGLFLMCVFLSELTLYIICIFDFFT